MSAFADPRVIRLATTEFVPVTADDWYQRRRQDAEGAFFRKMSDQTPRKAAGAGGTRQGIYVLTADGEALAYKNAGQLAGETLKQLEQGLEKFKRLPANRRAPGAVRVPPMGTPDPRYARRLPEGGVAVRVHARILDRAGDEFTVGRCETVGGDASARDFLWLTAADVDALQPPRREVGHQYPLPAAVANRLARYHLVDFTRGEPPFWTPEEVRSQPLTLTVTKIEGDRVELSLAGAVLCATDADPARADRGYDAAVRGTLTLEGKSLADVQVVALGEHWGEGPHTGSARPGRSLLGVGVGPVADYRGTPGDRVPPQAARDLADYLKVE